MAQKKLQELNLLDDFLFGTLLSSEDFGEPFGRILLEIIFQKKFGRLKVIPQKVYYGKDTDLHGTRLDVYLEEISDELLPGQASIYDMEPDNYPETLRELARRTRFYHSVIDSKSLKSGLKYEALKNVIVIFIMPEDPLGENRMVYTIRSMCEESPKLPYDDGARTLYLYTRGTVGDPPEALRQLLRYMEQSTDENAVNDRLKRIHHMVETVKRDGEVALSYMKSWDREERIRKEERQKVEQEKQKAEQERQKAEQERQKVEQERQKVEQEKQRILLENQRLQEEITRYEKQEKQLILSENQRLREEIARYKKELAELSGRS